MNSSLLLFLSPIPMTILAGVGMLRYQAASEERRLLALQAQTEKFRKAAAASTETTEMDWQEGSQALREMRDRFGSAGFLTVESRARVRRLRIAVLALGFSLPFLFGLLEGGVAVAATAGVLGFYAAITGWLYWLRYKRADFEREVLYQVPLVLEAIILLVESGLGILPALETTVTTREQTNRGHPVTIIFSLVYRLSAHGMPFSQALEMVAEATDSRVLRHVLLHLDISANEGGELVPSLRSLSDHAHTQWRLSVEQRVRRLENIVVFPVFAAVIGLMLLTAAVPLVPLLNLRETMDRSSTIISNGADSSHPLMFDGEAREH